MSRRRGKVFGVLLASLALATAPGASAVAQPVTQHSRPPGQSIGWHPCLENRKVECGTVRVPVAWSRPDGPTIEMAVARRHATNPQQRIGSLVLLPGGPGGSGVDSILHGLPVSPELASKFDIVSFDPRGTNRSHPVRCDSDLTRLPDAMQIPNGSPEQFQRVVDHNTELARSCRQHAGPLLDHMDSVSTAHDVDALRSALGEDKISLYGISYGTLTGEMYAENFPGRVRALLLDSVMDHSRPSRGFITSNAATDEDSFREFARWCGRDSECALHGQNVGRVFDDLYRRAQRGELHRPGDPNARISPIDLGGLPITAGYGPTWHRLARTLKTLQQQDASAQAALGPAKTAPFPIATLCADWPANIASAQQYSQLWQAQRRAAPDVRMSVGWTPMASCVGWPVPASNPPHRLDITGTPPILIMNSQHDPATSYEWATSVDRQVPAARLLTYDGWGHGVYTRNQCTTTAGDRYLVDLRVPQPGTHCPAVPPTEDTATAVPPAGPFPG